MFPGPTKLLFTAVKIGLPSLLNFCTTNVAPNIDSRDSKGQLTPLLYATQLNKTKLVEILVKNGANVSSETLGEKHGLTPLHFASKTSYC